MEQSKVSKKWFFLIGFGFTVLYFIVKWLTPLGELPFWEDLLWSLALGLFTGLVFGVSIQTWRKLRGQGAANSN